MKRYIRYISFLVAVVLLAAMPAYAQDEGTPYSSRYFSFIYTSLEQTADSAFRIWFEVGAAHGTKEELGASEILIQKSSDGVNFETIKTCTPSRYSSMMAYNTGAHAGYVIHAGTQGYYYRAQVKYYAKDSAGSGIWYDYSEILYLQPLNN